MLVCAQNVCPDPALLLPWSCIPSGLAWGFADNLYISAVIWCVPMFRWHPYFLFVLHFMSGTVFLSGDCHCEHAQCFGANPAEFVSCKRYHNLFGLPCLHFIAWAVQKEQWNETSSEESNQFTQHSHACSAHLGLDKDFSLESLLLDNQSGATGNVTGAKHCKSPVGSDDRMYVSNMPPSGSMDLKCINSGEGKKRDKHHSKDYLIHGVLHLSHPPKYSSLRVRAEQFVTVLLLE